MLFLYILIFWMCATSVPFPLPGEFNVTWLPGTCSGEDATLSSTFVLLSYHGVTQTNMTDRMPEIIIEKDILESSRIYNLTYGDMNIDSLSNVLYYFQQPEHGGGYCNCLDICFDNRMFG